MTAGCFEWLQMVPSSLLKGEKIQPEQNVVEINLAVIITKESMFASFKCTQN